MMEPSDLASGDAGEERVLPCEMLPALSLAVWEMSYPNLEIMSLSPAGEWVFGMPRDKLLDDDTFWRRHVCDADHAAVIDAFVSCATTGQMQCLCYRPRSRDRRVHWLRLRVAPAPQPDTSLHLVGVVEDATLEHLRQRHYREPTTLNLLAWLAEAQAHDLNNLVMVVGENVRMAAEETRQAEVRETLSIAEQALDRLQPVLTRMNAFAASAPMKRTTCDLTDVVLSAIEEARQLYVVMTGRPTSPPVDAQLEPTGEVEGDAGSLQWACAAVIVNCMEAATPHGAVTIHTTGNRTTAKVVVRDTAAAADYRRASLWTQAFFSERGDHRPGLGLPLADAILSAHGGSLSVETDETGGCFALTLPKSPAQVQATTTMAARKASGGLRVLLIDDDDEVLAVLERMIRRFGHEVVSAASGEQGLERLADQRFDILVTDQGMPGLSGAQVAAEAKQQIPGLPVILLTGLGEVAGSASGSVACVDAVLHKPIRSADLQQAIDSLVRSSPER